MNIYFLVEGSETETIVLPAWLSLLIPELNRVNSVNHITHNNYYLISGYGFPSLLNHLETAILEVNDNNNINYLVLCLDSENESPDVVLEGITNHLSKQNIQLNNAELKIFIAEKCIETWFLGNNQIYPRQPNTAEFIALSQFYNVSVNDPAVMPLHPDYKRHAHFHLVYLRKMLSERNIIYKKNNPTAVISHQYLTSLINRVDTTPHLLSMKNFFDFCRTIRGTINSLT